MNFNEMIQHRRSFYSFTKNSGVNDETLIQLVENILLTTPSAFDSQSQRIVLLLGDQHDLFWDMVLMKLKPNVSEEKFPTTQAKIQGFKSGQGTLLFYDDTNVTKEMKAKYPLYGDKAELWAYESNAMLQYVAWLGLADLGLSTSLQHYNPLIDQAAAMQFEIPLHWKMIAQMPFGIAAHEPKIKTQVPLDQRFKVKR